MRYRERGVHAADRTHRRKRSCYRHNVGYGRKRRLARKRSFVATSGSRRRIRGSANVSVAAVAVGALALVLAECVESVLVRKVGRNTTTDTVVGAMLEASVSGAGCEDTAGSKLGSRCIRRKGVALLRPMLRFSANCKRLLHGRQRVSRIVEIIGQVARWHGARWHGDASCCVR